MAISILSLAVASVTAWLTLFRRGTIKMTQPAIIFFGSDRPRSRDENPLPKVYLRTLMFSTAKRGRIVESMHVTLSRDETHQNFNVWAYGERERVVPGSGLFVGETGVALNHHFLPPFDGNPFLFTEGHYRLDVFVRLLGDRKPTLLFSQALEVTRDIADALKRADAGLYFNWGPDSSRYLAHVEERSSNADPEEFLRILGMNRQ